MMVEADQLVRGETLDHQLAAVRPSRTSPQKKSIMTWTWTPNDRIPCAWLQMDAVIEPADLVSSMVRSKLFES